MVADISKGQTRNFLRRERLYKLHSLRTNTTLLVALQCLNASNGSVLPSRVWRPPPQWRSPAVARRSTRASAISSSGIGYGRKNETFLLVTSFRLTHEAALDTVAAYFRDRAQSCVCKAGEAAEVSRVLVRECRDELKKANDVRFAIDPALRKRMHTLFVAQTILSIQRDAVCSLARRGLVSTREKEVLLEEVHEDLEAVFKLEEDRVSHHGEHDDVEHWVDSNHALPSRDFAAHFSAQPPEEGAVLTNSRTFGASGVYHSLRQRVGDTRRVLGLRNSGDAAEWCGAHISDTRRRMDQASAPASRDSD